MKTTLATATLAAAAFIAAPAFAEGDPAKGERQFRVCAACHTIEDPDGNRIAGRGATTGPNLYGVVGRAAGSVEGFNYRDGLIAAGEAGLVWDETTLTDYIPNAQQYIREFTGDSSVRVSMGPQRVRGLEDLVAFLAANSPTE